MDPKQDKVEEVEPMELDEKEKKVEAMFKKVDAPVLEEAELTEEDKALKEKLEGFVKDMEDASKQKEVFTEMRTAICAATSTMTSVPKPLKFLRPHFSTIKAKYETIEDKEIQKLCADVVSLLAMIEEGRDSVLFRLKGTDEPLSTFGHEYIRHLAGQVSDEYNERTTGETTKDTADLLKLVELIIPFLMASNAEAEACDLAMEVEQLDLLKTSCDIKGYSRVCLYLLRCIPFVPEPQDDALKRTCLDIFKNFNQWPQAMQMALKINDPKIIQDIFFQPEDKFVRRQLAFMLARQGVVLDVGLCRKIDTEVCKDLALKKNKMERRLLTTLMSNQKLNENFLALGRELDILEAKTPEDVYKTHLEASGRSTANNLDSAKANLASTFVNAFVNSGFGKDKLITEQGSSKTSWINRNKDKGQFSAAASLGMILMWDVEGGLQKIDPYLLSEIDNVKAGAMLATGIVTAGVADDNDPAYALLDDYVCHDKMIYRVGSIMALGLAYAGSANQMVGEKLCEALADPKSNMEVIGATCVALGQIYVGTCDGDITEAVITLLMEKSEEDLSGTHGKLAALGLGMLYLGKQKAAEVAMQGLVALPDKFQNVAKMLLDTCSYAATGNVLKVQSLLHSVSEHVDTEAESFKEGDDAYQAFATLGVALVAMGEETGVEMVMRMFTHLLRYGELVIRRVVPLAIALLYTSNPKLQVLDLLSKLSHDADATTAHCAILAIGMIGAGTNHARIAAMLRMLAQYYFKDPNTLFVVRLAQGLIHTGKGSISMTPFHTERSLMSPVAVSGLLSFLVSAMDMQETLLKDSHYMMFHLALAMYPRILCTFVDDDHLTSTSTSVRVGMAVDTVGQAGVPKTITGFVTNNTPVLLSYGERAQLATEEYLPVTPLLEGFVILKKNPDYEQ